MFFTETWKISGHDPWQAILVLFSFHSHKYIESLLDARHWAGHQAYHGEKVGMEPAIM